MLTWILIFARIVVKNVFLQTAVMYPAYITKGVLLPFFHHNTVVYLERHKILLLVYLCLFTARFIMHLFMSCKMFLFLWGAGKETLFYWVYLFRKNKQNMFEKHHAKIPKALYYEIHVGRPSVFVRKPVMFYAVFSGTMSRLVIAIYGIIVMVYYQGGFFVVRM